jgi:hypothetical protein
MTNNNIIIAKQPSHELAAVLLVPGAVHIRPGAVHIWPGAVHIRPGAVHIRPGAVHIRPGAVHIRYVAGTMRTSDETALFQSGSEPN